MAQHDPHYLRTVESGQPSRVYDYASLAEAKRAAKKIGQGFPSGGYVQIFKGRSGTDNGDGDPVHVHNVKG